jgi:hypothetical protein
MLYPKMAGLIYRCYSWDKILCGSRDQLISLFIFWAFFKAVTENSTKSNAI